jgi:hypothetical protein
LKDKKRVTFFISDLKRDMVSPKKIKKKGERKENMLRLECKI